MFEMFRFFPGPQQIFDGGLALGMAGTLLLAYIHPVGLVADREV